MRVAVSQLTSKNMTDSNEKMGVVRVVRSDVEGFMPRSPYRVPPFSMTVFQWTASQ